MRSASVRYALGSALLCTASLPAQVTVGFIAATELKVSAFADFPDQQTIPEGTTLLDPTNMRATATCAVFNGAASAGLDLRSTTAIGARITLSASAGSATSVPGFGCGGASVGPHAIVATLSSPSPVAGRMRITAEASPPDPLCQFFCPRPGFGVDVLNDGSDELSFQVTAPQGSFPFMLELPVVLTGQGTEFRLSHELTDGWLTLELEFLPDPTNLQAIGSPCGPTLQGMVLPHPDGSRSLELRAANSLITEHAFFIFGKQSLSLPLPQLGCPLLTDVLIGVRSPVDPAGRAALSVPIPRHISTADLRIQYLSGVATPTGPDWTTSNALRIILP